MSSNKRPSAAAFSIDAYDFEVDYPLNVLPGPAVKRPMTESSGPPKAKLSTDAQVTAPLRFGSLIENTARKNSRFWTEYNSNEVDEEFLAYMLLQTRPECWVRCDSSMDRFSKGDNPKDDHTFRISAPPDWLHHRGADGTLSLYTMSNLDIDNGESFLNYWLGKIGAAWILVKTPADLDGDTIIPSCLGDTDWSTMSYHDSAVKYIGTYDPASYPSITGPSRVRANDKVCLERARSEIKRKT